MTCQLAHLPDLMRRHVDAFQASRAKLLGQHVRVVPIVLGTSVHQSLHFGRMNDLGIVASCHDAVVIQK